MRRLTKSELTNLTNYLNDYKSWKERYPEEDERLTMIAAHTLGDSSYSGATYWYKEDLLFDVIKCIIKKYGEEKTWTEEELKVEAKKQIKAYYGGE